jgi:hypothetical protein
MPGRFMEAMRAILRSAAGRSTMRRAMRGMASPIGVVYSFDASEH